MSSFVSTDEPPMKKRFRHWSADPSPPSPHSNSSLPPTMPNLSSTSSAAKSSATAPPRHRKYPVLLVQDEHGKLHANPIKLQPTVKPSPTRISPPVSTPPPPPPKRRKPSTPPKPHVDRSNLPKLSARPKAIAPRTLPNHSPVSSPVKSKKSVAIPKSHSAPTIAPSKEPSVHRSPISNLPIPRTGPISKRGAVRNADDIHKFWRSATKMPWVRRTTEKKKPSPKNKTASPASRPAVLTPASATPLQSFNSTSRLQTPSSKFSQNNRSNENAKLHLTRVFELNRICALAHSKANSKMNLRGRRRLEEWLGSTPFSIQSASLLVHMFNITRLVVSENPAVRRTALMQASNEHLRILQALMTRLMNRNGQANWSMLTSSYNTKSFLENVNPDDIMLQL